MMMVRAFWLTEKVVVQSQLPGDRNFNALSENDRSAVVAVLQCFGDLLLFEGLPYEISGRDALKRLGR
jgi:hypothetical protein